MNETKCECSVWCQPENGVHVFVDYVDREVDIDDLMNGRFEVHEPVITGQNVCMDIGTVFDPITIEPATEAPPSDDPEYPYAYLWTVQVINKWATS